jgi:hypothetical protein
MNVLFHCSLLAGLVSSLANEELVSLFLRVDAISRSAPSSGCYDSIALVPSSAGAGLGSLSP